MCVFLVGEGIQGVVDLLLAHSVGEALISSTFAWLFLQGSLVEVAGNDSIWTHVLHSNP